MNSYEWDGEAYVPRHAEDTEPLGATPTQWVEELPPGEWRRIFLECLGTPEPAPGDEEHEGLLKELQRGVTASFSDGINTGFYINAYTTKHCPTMDGVLTEMRRGLERLEQAREAEQERLKVKYEALTKQVCPCPATV